MLPVGALHVRTLPPLHQVWQRRRSGRYGLRLRRRLVPRPQVDKVRSALCLNVTFWTHLFLYLPIFPSIIYPSPLYLLSSSPYVIHPFPFVLFPCTLLITRTCILGWRRLQQTLPLISSYLSCTLRITRTRILGWRCLTCTTTCTIDILKTL